MCGMLGAAHYEYQWSILEQKETGKNTVAVRPKAWDLKKQKQKNLMKIYFQEDKVL